MGDDDDDRRRRRRRGLLRMYYGEDAKADQARKKNPLDINDESFNGKEYLKKLFETSHLRSLIEKEVTIDREIKSLDSDMQTLVYENYNKFISATDTIRKMKDQVDGMEAEMQKLSSSMETTTELSDNILSTLRSKRDEIRRLASGHAMLKKFQFLFELPSRLRQCIEMNAIEQAVKYYSKAASALESFKDIASFQGIYSSCIDIMSKLQDKLESKISDPSTKLSVVRDTFLLLGQIGFIEENELANKLLEQAHKQWISDLQHQETIYATELEKMELIATNEIKSKSLEKITDVKDVDMVDNYESGSKSDIIDGTQLMTNQTSHEDITHDAPGTNPIDAESQAYNKQETPSNRHPAMLRYLELTRRQLLFNFAEWIISYQDLFLPSGPSSNEPSRQQRTEQLHVFVDNLLINDLIPSCKAKIVILLEWKDLTANELKSYLQDFYQGISKLTDLVHGSKAKQNINTVISDISSKYTEHLRQATTRKIKEIIQSTSMKEVHYEETQTVANNACIKLDQLLLEWGNKLETLSTLEYADRIKFNDEILSKAVVRDQMLKDSTRAVVLYLQELATSERTAMLSYQIAKIWSSEFVMKRLTAILSKFPSQSKNDLDDGLLPMTSNLLCNATQVLLKRFVQLSSERFSKEVIFHTRKSALLKSALKDSSETVQGIVKDLGQLTRTLDDILSSQDIPPLEQLSPLTTPTGQHSVTHLQRLFSEAICVFQDPNGTLENVLACILLAIAKAFCEAIRECTLSSVGAQQLTNDVRYLHQHFAPFVYDEETDSSIVSLLSQAAGSIARRVSGI